jgi:hypothetical protein
MRRWVLLGLVLLGIMWHLTACAPRSGEQGGEAAAPPTTNPMGQPAVTNTPGAAAEERKAGGY